MPRLASIAALLLVTSALAPAAAPAAATPRLTPAGTTARPPVSDGTALVWEAPQGDALVRRVPGARSTERLLLTPGCALRSVSRAGLAVVRCPGDVAEVRDTRTGRVLATLALEPGAEPVRVGRSWVEVRIELGCSHCDSRLAINWRTGERRRVGSYADEPVLDLDEAHPQRFSEAWQDGDGRVDVVMWGGEDRFRVFRDRRLVRTVRSHVAFGPEMFVVARGRVAWIEADEPGGAPARVRELRPVSGRARSWPVGGVPGGRSSSARLLRVGADLVYAVPVRPRIPHGRYRVLRAR